MLDYTAVWNKETTLSELVADLTIADLQRLTNEMTDTVLGLIAECRDEDVTFQPVDPHAQDDAAADASEMNIAWTLGHVIVHTTAGSEETAFLAAEMARGVEPHGRSRYETPWQEMQTVTQLRQRLEESRRMRLATLDVWPDQPHLDVVMEYPFLDGPVDARGQFLLGLMHEDSHLDQIREIIRQAHSA
jgi:hypothetical protein